MKRWILGIAAGVILLAAGVAVGLYLSSRNTTSPDTVQRDGPAESACEAIQTLPTGLYGDAQRMAYIGANGSSSNRHPKIKAAADELGNRADAVLNGDYSRAASLTLQDAAMRLNRACVDAGYSY